MKNRVMVCQILALEAIQKPRDMDTRSPIELTMLSPK